MAPLARYFGLLLVLLGVAGFIYGFLQEGDARNVLTALIPAAVGIVLFFLGVLAQKENLRKHAMHAAALVGLLGFVGALVQPVRKLIADGELPLTASVVSQGAMALLCLLFVVLCVKSFSDARKAREKNPQ